MNLWKKEDIAWFKLDKIQITAIRKFIKSWENNVSIN